MILAISLGVGALFGCGLYLVVKPDLFRIVVGMALIANGANLAVIGAAVERGPAPIHPAEPTEAADPLVQAMTLTAIVISFAVIALLLALVHGVYRTHDTVDLEGLSGAESGRRGGDREDDA